MKNSKLLLLNVIFIALFTTQCKKDNAVNPNQTFDEYRTQVDERLNVMFQSFATNMSTQFDKEVRDADYFLHNKTYTVSGITYSVIGILYRDFGSIVSTPTDNDPNTSDLSFRQLQSGIYDWNPAQKKFIKTTTNTNTVVINYPLDSATTSNNMRIEYSNLEMTKVVYLKNTFTLYEKNGYASGDYYFGYGIYLNDFIKTGTELIKKNNIELSKIVYDNNFNINFRNDVSGGVDYTYLNGNITKYYKGNINTKYSYNEDTTFQFQHTLYENNQSPTVIRFHFTNNGNNRYNKNLFTNLDNYDIDDLNKFTVSLLTLEPFFRNFDSLISFDIQKGSDLLSLNFNMNHITTTDGEIHIPYAIPRYNIIEGVTSGYLNQNNERVFNLVRENNVLYTDYIKDNKRVNANDYLVPNFNPIENEIESMLETFLSN
jgi:hypothetical protein